MADGGMDFTSLHLRCANVSVFRKDRDALGDDLKKLMVIFMMFNEEIGRKATSCLLVKCGRKALEM